MTVSSSLVISSGQALQAGLELFTSTFVPLRSDQDPKTARNGCNISLQESTGCPFFLIVTAGELERESDFFIHTRIPRYSAALLCSSPPSHHISANVLHFVPTRSAARCHWTFFSIEAIRVQRNIIHIQFLKPALVGMGWPNQSVKCPISTFEKRRRERAMSARRLFMKLLSKTKHGPSSPSKSSGYRP